MGETASMRGVLDQADEARAYCYAVVSRLFFGPPEREFVEQLAGASIGSDDAPLGQAWAALIRDCAAADLAAARQEYDDLFVGVGQAPVTLYTSHYTAPRGPDRHLLALRGELMAWGLGRSAHVGETEDHVSGLCDVMRWLIESGHSEAEQRRFFSTYVETAGGRLCAAIVASRQADFYKGVARFADTFFSIEREAFDLLQTERPER